MLRASEGLETLSETDHIHRSLCARYWKGQNKDCHRSWQSKSNSTARSEPPTNGGNPSSASSVELRECSDTIQLRGRPKVRRSSGQCHKEVNTGHENEVAHLCQANEPVSTWTRCVQ